MPDLRFPDHALVQQMVERCVDTGEPLMLAHDDGVYLCCDAIRTPEGPCVCAYARGCHPRVDPEWFETARRLVGGDDFGERLDLRGATTLVEALRRGDRLVVRFNKRTISLFHRARRSAFHDSRGRQRARQRVPHFCPHPRKEQ